MKASAPVKWLSLVVALFSLHSFSTDLSAYEVNTTSLGAEIRWAAPSATYYVNAAGGPSGSLTALQSAMQTWSAVDGFVFSFVYGGTTINGAHGVNDGVNIVGFGPIGQAVLAENRFWYDTLTGHIYDSDIRFNTNYSFSTAPSGFVYDVQTVALHELGHALSLKDLCSTADQSKAMYCAVFWAQIRRSLSQDDIDGIVHLYPLSSCTYAIAPLTQTFYADGGTGTVTVAPGSSKCTWTAVSNDPWIVVSSGANGAGNGTVEFSVAPNGGATSRVGTIAFAGKIVTVTQSGVQQRLLSVSRSGSGYGTVTSDPPGIDCGSDCSHFFNPDSSVALNALADSGSAFIGWYGTCAGQGSCTVTMTADRSVTAIFDQQLGGEFSLSLAAGWNFVSIPLSPLNPAIADVLKDVSPDLRVVWGYDNRNKGWLKYTPATAGASTLTSLEQGKGYWIYMLNGRTLTIATDQMAPQDIKLYEGWNLVGYSGNDGLTVENALSDLDNDWIILWGWEKGEWSVTTPANLPLSPSISRLSTLKKGKAIWIKIVDLGGPVIWKINP